MTRKLLLVEDDDGARTVLKAALESRGMHVFAARTVREALDMAEHAPGLDAVITDVVLDETPSAGLDWIPLLRARGVFAPVIAVTAFADKQRLKRAIELRVSYLLEKPFSVEQLLNVLNRVCAEPTELAQYVERALSSVALTPKEREVARLMLKGLSNDEIARLLHNSEKTVRQHLSAIYAKCGVASRAEFFHFVFPT